MKKALIVSVLVVALVFAFAASAFADHSPTFYVEWQVGVSHAGYGTTTFGNPAGDSPHANYLEGTEKCGVCHSVHRAPVGPGISWESSGTPGAQTPAQAAVRTKVAGGQYDRQNFITTGTAGAQMLLKSTVADSCDYCHVITSIGGEQLYGGKTAYKTSEWQEGYAHGNACSGCHAVHGVATNYGDPAQYGLYGTFQGPIQAKILKVRAKGAGGAGNLAYVWQDETIAIGSAAKIDIANNSTNPALQAWAAAQTAQDFAGVVSPPDVTAVDPLNVPLFPSKTDAILGTNVRPGTDAEQAQASVFCTFCHQNYGTASEAVVNPDGDKSLFQGPWWALAGTVANVTGTPGVWQNANNGTAQVMPFKNHPLKSIDGTFTAAGKAASVPTQVAFAGAETCVSCHDAGVRDTPGFVLESYPHFTPGYFHFTKTAAHVGGAMTYAPPVLDVYATSDTAGIAAAQAFLDDPANYDKSITVADGQCLKCHVNAAETAGVGKSY